MRVRKLARWAAGLVAVVGFGVAAVLGATAASADETDTSGPDPVETERSDEWA